MTMTSVAMVTLPATSVPVRVGRAGLGLILTGIAVRRRGRWAGWRGLVVLVASIFVFVPMTLALMRPFVLACLAITVWTLVFAALGYALWKADER